MRSPQKGICCAGCPHRAAYIVCKEAMGRKRSHVICGDAGCPAVGLVHPAATTCPGGMERLMPRYNVPVPTGTPEEPGSEVCIHFALDTAVTKADQANAYEASRLAGEGSVAVLAVLASSRAFLTREALEGLADALTGLGYADITVVDPFDTLRCADVLANIMAAPGTHALVFASPCAQLLRKHVPEPAEVDPYSCVGCQRCGQIVGCPALSFHPPAYQIDPEVCTGCDLCLDFCRTHVILSPRGHMTPEEISRERYAAALGELGTPDA